MVDSEFLFRLREQRFLSQFPWQYIEKLARMANQVSFEGGTLIFQRDEESRYFYVILTGLVALELTTPEKTVVVQTLGPGEEFGWSSLLAFRRRFQAHAIEDVCALAFEGARLRHECEQDYEFGYKLLRRLLNVAAERLEATQAHAPALFSEPPLARQG